MSGTMRVWVMMVVIAWGMVGCSPASTTRGDDGGAANDGSTSDTGVSTPDAGSVSDTGVDADHELPDLGVPDAWHSTDAGRDTCTVDVATTCAGRCGPVTDPVCGVSIDCPDACVAPETCNGGGTPTFCGCTDEPNATTCSGHCGTVANNCGTLIDCGDPCTGFDTCGGGSAGPHVCGCTPVASPCAGQFPCGTGDDGCGNYPVCDSCPASRHCDTSCNFCLYAGGQCP